MGDRLAGLLACGSALGPVFPESFSSDIVGLHSPLTVAGAAAALPKGAPQFPFNPAVARQNQSYAGHG